jgi:hypothetical protein
LGELYLEKSLHVSSLSRKGYNFDNKEESSCSNQGQSKHKLDHVRTKILKFYTYLELILTCRGEGA